MEFQLSRPDIAIPAGFYQLARDISREVLRCEPEKIEEYIADYLELKELATRTQQIWLQSVTVPSIITPDLTIQIMQLFETCEIAEQWKYYCINILMQEFGHIERLLINGDVIQEIVLNKSVKNVVLHDDGLLNQASKHCSLTSDEIAALKDAYQRSFDHFLRTILKENCERASTASMFKYDYEMINQILTKIINFSTKYSPASIISLEQFPSVATINSAAIKIQAIYRGYRARQLHKELKRHAMDTHLTERERIEHSAAARIQSAYRRHLAKRQLYYLQKYLNGFEHTYWPNTDLRH